MNFGGRAEPPLIVRARRPRPARFPSDLRDGNVGFRVARALHISS
jgi:hypothetical protein